MAGGAKKSAKFMKAGSGSALGRLRKAGRSGDTMIKKLLRGERGDKPSASELKRVKKK